MPVCPFATHLFANTGPGTASFKDNDGDTTTVLNVGRKENNKSTVAFSGRENSQRVKCLTCKDKSDPTGDT